ncbi:hypothetical protein [Paraliomyxa miuraensis]|uniref:hypothetical protein n=1 Tax=Paraliomyxa miuraensis TaxID=376150 RepID=UPI00224EB4DD|nr:hypothetical protein [Paraliomyxa miuraensis]MCX4247230.1 hypothetical protein [Paraliomyxa miuraensis]
MSSKDALMKQSTIGTLGAVLLLAPACRDTGGSEGGSDDSGGIVTIDGSSSTGFDDSFLDESGTGTTGDPMPTFRCNAVDFIFVIDNSPSMLDEQQFLVQGVPGFVSAMQNALPSVESIQVGVIDTDSYPGLGTIENPLDGCDPEVVPDCSVCDYQLGAFLDKPESASDPETSCNFSTGKNFMDGFGDDFANEFGCAALVGAVGNPIEQQAGAVVAAVSEDLQGAGACNEGFVRDDALLVVLVISDEEDNWASPPEPQGGSVGEPGEWFDALVAAKNGRDANVVGLGLVGGSPKFDDCADLSQGVDGAEQSSRLVDFVERFPTNFVGSVCSEGYGDFFQEALVKVSEGCANFIP